MGISKLDQNQVDKRSLVYRIIFIIGALLSFSYVLFKADAETFFAGAKSGSLLNLFTDNINVFNSMFKGMFENLPPALVSILILWLPMALMIITSVLLFARPYSKISFIFGVAGAVIFIIVDILYLKTATVYLGVFINLSGSILAGLGLALYYIGDDDERVVDYEGGRIVCTGGEFNGANFDLISSIVIGKDANRCNIVLENDTVSRIHCVIKYDEETEIYTICDKSSNGTFLSDGTKLERDVETEVKSGTEIYLGEPRESFFLN